MKKTLLKILVLIMSISMLLTLAVGCGHTHDYKELKKDGAEHWYECTCGEKDGVEAHKGGSATCAVKAVCEVCGESYGDFATEHAYGAWTSNGDGTHTRVCGNDATHTETENCTGGTATCVAKAVCDVCNAEHGELNPDNHLFTNYVYNNNAGYGVNGTETATCDRGCGATDTREKLDTAIMAVDLGKTVYGKNDATALAIDLSTYELAEIDKVVIGGEVIAFTYENGIVTIANDVLPNGVVKSGNSMVSAPVEISVDVKGCIFGLSATIADFAIDSEADFVAWRNAIIATNTSVTSGWTTKSFHAVLTANVTLTEQIGKDTAGYNQGVLDGMGYTLDGLSTVGKLFYGQTAFTIKNIAIINWKNAGNDHGYLLANATYKNICIENSYIDAEVTKYSSTVGFSNNGAAYYITNSILELNWVKRPTDTIIYPLFRANPPTSTNTYIISRENMLNTAGSSSGGMENSGLFTSFEALYAELNKTEGATVTTTGFENHPYITITREEGQIVSIAWTGNAVQA